VPQKNVVGAFERDRNEYYKENKTIYGVG